ncbi:hypothetical protein [Paenibacillus pini]|uniref:Uncharacterized protein n=1 Tax=Paenibacillus pini JCM 16418 TaxID=1236976 RepID=W7YUJ6_9BACL|nr:hypothetical protein [Paenibacillus pini]GAF10893.1 hypothetical protein JCM16418_5125 [Paenibacillus pini JCM 16418]
MNTLIARTSIGGRDLYFGVPNLEGASIVSVKESKTTDDYCTELTLYLKNESTMKLLIKQEIE